MLAMVTFYIETPTHSPVHKRMVDKNQHKLFFTTRTAAANHIRTVLKVSTEQAISLGYKILPYTLSTNPQPLPSGYIDRVLSTSSYDVVEIRDYLDFLKPLNGVLFDYLALSAVYDSIVVKGKVHSADQAILDELLDVTRDLLILMAPTGTSFKRTTKGKGFFMV